MSGIELLVLAGALALAAGLAWMVLLGYRHWVAVIRRREAIRAHQRLRTEIQHKYAAICSHLTTGPGWNPERQQALEWALEQIDQVLQRQREDDKAAAIRTTPSIRAVAGPVLAAVVGVVLLVVAAVCSR
jgi:hypothetical protein